jgi:hypothetical protein
VRPRSAIALEEIMDHLITQGTDSAAQYAENFMQRARILSHISPVVLCHHFVHGLQPVLKQLVVLIGKVVIGLPCTLLFLSLLLRTVASLYVALILLMMGMILGILILLRKLV